MFSSWNLPGSVDDQIVNPLYSSREVWFLVADDLGSIIAVVVLLQTIQTI